MEELQQEKAREVSSGTGDRASWGARPYHVATIGDIEVDQGRCALAGSARKRLG
jgi:hypothetical protein